VKEMVSVGIFFGLVVRIAGAMSASPLSLYGYDNYNAHRISDTDER